MEAGQKFWLLPTRSKSGGLDLVTVTDVGADPTDDSEDNETLVVFVYVDGECEVLPLDDFLENSMEFHSGWEK